MIPKTWRDMYGIRRHTVGLNDDAAVPLVISKTWSRRHQSWKYHVDTLETVEFYRRFGKQQKARTA